MPEITNTGEKTPIISPLYGFQDVSFRLLVNLSSRYVQFGVKLTQRPKKNFIVSISFRITSLNGIKPPLTVGQSFTFTKRSNCAYLNSEIETHILSDFAKNGILLIKFKFNHRDDVSAVPQLTSTYAGLANQGATCYLNSLLQALFHLPAFRMIVYQIPIDDGKDKANSIPYNLQKLFVNMQHGGVACSTLALTKSFGWTAEDSFLQRDIQELCRVFIENLEQVLDKTPMKDSIAKLFRGTMEQYVKCVNVSYESAHSEFFYDLSVNVEGCSCLDESLRKFLEVEKLEGENQYETTEFGKQDAVLGTRLTKLPPVLYLHLRRFQYDARTNQEVKINSRFEFPTYLDMSSFVPDGKDEKYELFGILVHSGSAHFGHYYAYLRPTRDSQWFKFNDRIVTLVDESVAVEGSFGSNDRCDSAYMLIFYKQSELDRLFDASYGTNLIPPDEEPEDTSNCVQIVTESSLRKRCGELDLDPGDVCEMLDLPSGELTGRKLTQFAADILGFPLWKTNVWAFDGDSLQFVPPRSVPVSNLLRRRIFVRVSQFPVLDHELLIFIKYFDCREDPQIKFLTTQVVSSHSRVSSICPNVCDVLGVPQDVPLLFFKKQHYDTFQAVDTNDTFTAAKIKNGSILVVQLDPSVAQPKITFPFGETDCPPPPPTDNEGLDVVNLNVTDVISTVPEYLSTKYSVAEAVVSNYDDPSQRLFIIRYTKLSKLHDVKKAIAEKIGIQYDPAVNSMLLYNKSVNSDEPNLSPLSRLFIGSKRLFFRSFEVPEAELAELVPISCFCDDVKRTVIIRKETTVQELIERVNMKADECLVHVEYGGYQLRPVELSENAARLAGVVKIIKKPDLAEDEKLLPVCHSVGMTLFKPFLFVVKKGEKIAELKARLAKEIGIELPAFSKLGFRFRKLVSTTGVITSAVSEVNDDTDIFSVVEPGCCIDLTEKYHTPNTPIIRATV